MIQSKPKVSVMVSVGLFFCASLVAATWIFAELIQRPASYFLLKLFLAPTLLVISILVFTKSYSSWIQLSLGNNQIAYRYPMQKTQRYPLKEITSWREDVVKGKSSTYRRLSIELAHGKKVQISNHENSHYADAVAYLKKKVKIRK